MTNTILVVDDEIGLHETYKRMFRKEIQSGKYLFYYAKDGQEALERFKKNHQIAVILLDLEMPNMNGIELMYELKQAASHPPLLVERRRFYKIVIVSAYDDMGRIRKCMNNGASEFIVKNPIDWDELKLVLDKMLEEVNDMKRLESMRANEAKRRETAERKLGQMQGILNGTMGGGVFGS